MGFSLYNLKEIHLATHSVSPPRTEDEVESDFCCHGHINLLLRL